MFSPLVMGEPLSSQQFLYNSYHLFIRSSIQAIQTTLLAQTIMLQSQQHTTLTDIKSVIASQNTTLQRITKTLVETSSKISSYKPPPQQPRYATTAATPARSPPPIAPTTTAATAGTISTTVPITPQTLLPATIMSSPKAAPSLSSAATTNTFTTLSPSATLLSRSHPSTAPANIMVATDSVVAPAMLTSPHITVSVISSTSATKASPTTAGLTTSPPISRTIAPYPVKGATAALPSSKSFTSPPAMSSTPPPPLPPANSPPPSHSPTFVPMRNSVHYQSDAYYTRAAVFKVLCATQNSSSYIELKENNAHNVFVERKKLKREWTDAPTLFAERNKPKYERKTFIFDPGGAFNIESNFDLEDKVVLERLVMIRIWPCIRLLLGLKEESKCPTVRLAA